MDLRTIISIDDYPPEARARGEQGTVILRLLVSEVGRVTSCTVVQSATPALDSATCELFKLRARFAPARNEAGNAIASEVDVSPIRWQID
ncbi:energy transducer TonB [Sphingosinicella sp. LHD-64]|uniref:energy transducer TonB n=1 Tax=Sphingosinicella sp. LHD-64 TaxID=3072139 RepID=UPI00280FE715|nr:energy transducer TonB [Sphingosinicella sp. LHD-64]MDQ8757677.1 energy transducer TonB [Sphingosinicella sp. LHD-64]